MDVFKELNLYKEIVQSCSFESILDFCGNTLETLPHIESYAFFLLDESKEKLIISKVNFTGKFQAMGQILYKTSYLLGKNSIYFNIMETRQDTLIFQHSLGGLSAEITRAFELWEAKSIFYLPIIPSTEEHNSQTPIGILMLLNHQQELAPSALSAVKEILTIFYHPLKHSLTFSQIKNKEAEILNGYNRNFQILELANNINNLTSIEIIYETILDKLLTLYHLDFGMLFLQKDNMLLFKASHIRDSKYQDRINHIVTFLKTEKGYKIDPPEGACSVSHARNTYFYFPDVSNIQHLPMSPIDRKIIDTLETPRTFLLMPIRKNGLSIGNLHLYTLEKTINLTETDIKVMESLCSLLGIALTNSEIYTLVENQRKKLEEKNHIIQQRNKQLVSELKLAQQIQQKLIPMNPPAIPGLKIATYYKPMENIGGDFFDFSYHPQSGTLGIFISDVSGHGVPAALIASMVKILIDTSDVQSFSPGEMLNYINEKISGQTGGNFLTAFYGILDLTTLTLKYARAAHPYPFLIRQNCLTELHAHGKMLGITQNLIFEEKEIQLRSGDKILFYTDGLTEASNHENIEFEDRLKHILVQESHKPADLFIQTIYHELIKHREEYHLEDDVCLINLEID